MAVGEKRLAAETILVNADHMATVMLVSEGYPDKYEKGKLVSGGDALDESIIFHAGTIIDPVSGHVITSGGRVMAVTSAGKSLKEALSKSYRTAEKIRFEGKNYRKDIGFDL
jgi:phosphoribosylamine--glycine ligase